MEGILQAVVGTNIRRVRLEQGLSQESFGEAVGWHRTFVGAVERGERNLTLKSVERIADQLLIHPLELLRDPSVVSSEPAPAPVLRAAGQGGDPASTAGTRRSRPRPS